MDLGLVEQNALISLLTEAIIRAPEVCDAAMP
jgi:hypothetical protein